jgi:ribulose-5-phosphate 4-epimerase/fuculose-1-phosphate aldolase
MSVNMTLAFSSLITANHILSFYNVLDAYGHISMRNPANASTFLLSRDLPPALVSNTSDIVEYLVETAGPVLGSAAPKGFIERFIHSELYKRFPAVQSVIHSHAESVVPFGVVEVPFTALEQRGTVLGTTGSAPVWDIASARLPTDPPTFLVLNARFGASLAETFGPANTTTMPEHRVGLMRGHGMAVAGVSIIDSVFAAMNTVIAAREVYNAMTLAALGGSDGQPNCNHAPNGTAGSIGNCGAINYLTDAEKAATSGISLDFQGRGWELWVRTVQAEAKGLLYRNLVGSPL